VAEDLLPIKRLGGDDDSQDFKSDKIINPRIVQVYGTYSPSTYSLFLRDYMNVTSFMAFPHAHHDTNGYMKSKLVSSKLDKGKIQDLVMKLFEGNHQLDLNPQVKLRKEAEGAIIYTPEHNVYHLNDSALSMLFSFKGKRVSTILEKASLSELKILIRLLLMNILVAR